MQMEFKENSAVKNDEIIRLEKKQDYRNVESLTRKAFWNVYRPGCWEHYILHQYRKRADFIPELSLVVEQKGKIIGHIMYVHSEIQTDDHRLISTLTFGPFSIAPEYQHQGYGALLLKYSMDQAKQMGAGALLIFGSASYYGKFGFVAAETKKVYLQGNLKTTDTPYFLIKELNPGFLDGVSGTYKVPDGYYVSEEEVEKFDASFLPKEKRVRSGQLV